MSRLFHVAPQGYEVGIFIAPGRWGANMRAISPANARQFDLGIQWNLMWEIALESARLRLAPDKPSRLHCVFACPTFEGAAAFRNMHRKGCAIYEVSPQAGSPIHAGDFDLLNCGGEPLITAMLANSGIYWSDRPPTSPEMVIGGIVKVTAVVQEG